MVTSYKGHTIRTVFGGSEATHIVDDDKEFTSITAAMNYVDTL